MNLVLRQIFFNDDSDVQREEKKTASLEEKLKTLGEHYLAPAEMAEASIQHLWNISLEYDKKGLIPHVGESVRDFVYRANSILFLHNLFRKNRIMPSITLDKKTFDVTLGVDSFASIVRKEDIIEANKRIPYNMDLSWVTAFIGGGRDSGRGSGLLNLAYGVCLTSPKYNGFNFLLMRDNYKSREKFLRVLAHEMTHMGTVHLDTRKDFLETKAYISGSAAFGEYTIAVNKRPHIALRAINFLFLTFFRFQLPNYAISAISKIKSTIEIADKKRMFNGVGRRLTALYGKNKGNYILGRLSADEIEEFRYTNDVPARISQKTDLKWRIMRRNFEDFD